jgi:DNA-binding transcriptional MerR regulator
VPTEFTIDELARAAGTTTRSIRSFQTMGLIDPPSLRGRTGLYGADHLDRVHAILRLQAAGFALQSLSVLFEAYQRGDTLADLLGLQAHATAELASGESDITELYGFADLLGARRGRRPRGKPLLSVVPTTVWNETEAS